MKWLPNFLKSRCDAAGGGRLEVSLREAGWVYRGQDWAKEVSIKLEDPSGLSDGLADAALPPALLLGMMGPYGEVCIRGGKVCGTLRRGADAAERLMLERFEDAHAVRLRAGVRRAARGGAGGGKPCVCFTGGVDSCFSAWKLRDQSAGLLFVNGFDIPLGNPALHQQVRGRLTILAKDLGLPLCEIETNLREATDRYALWGKRAFGAALASMAHILPEGYSGLAIPASYDLSNLMTAGSMADLDPLWSSARRQVTHHGVETSRYEKIRQLGDWPLALKHLRVCWVNPENAYNCGRCEKCVRTLVLLEMAGLSQLAVSFDAGLNVEAIADLQMGSTIVLSHWEQIHGLLEGNSRRDSLRRGVGLMLRRNRQRFGLDESPKEAELQI